MSLALETRDLAAIKHEAWALVNQARKAVGLQPVLFFPASIRNDESHCVIASSIPLHPKSAQQLLIAAVWQTRVTTEQEIKDRQFECDTEDYFINYSGAWIKLPAVVTRFRNLFNEGHYPELEQES